MDPAAPGGEAAPVPATPAGSLGRSTSATDDAAPVDDDEVRVAGDSDAASSASCSCRVCSLPVRGEDRAGIARLHKACRNAEKKAIRGAQALDRQESKDKSGKVTTEREDMLKALREEDPEKYKNLVLELVVSEVSKTAPLCVAKAKQLVFTATEKMQSSKKVSRSEGIELLSKRPAALQIALALRVFENQVCVRALLAPSRVV